MEATVFLGVGVGLVSCIDDWSLQGRFETNLFFEEVCTLTDLKRYEIRGETEFASDFPGPTEDLAGDEVRGDFRNDSSKGKVTINEVVLVTSVRVPFPIRVVLVRNNRLTFGLDRVGSPHRFFDNQFG